MPYRSKESYLAEPTVHYDKVHNVFLEEWQKVPLLRLCYDCHSSGTVLEGCFDFERSHFCGHRRWLFWHLQPRKLALPMDVRVVSFS